MLTASVPAPVPVASTVPVVEERFAKFEKMKKMLPEGAVRQKMTGEGFTPAEIDGFFAGTVGYTTGTGNECNLQHSID